MAFRFDKFTIKAQEAVQRAQEIAADRGNAQVEALHLLAALVAEEQGVVRPLLDKIGVDRGRLDQIIQSELGHLPRMSGAAAQPQMGESLARV
ncbi:MAG: ATP-dependent chaperone ClpB, partial [Planctomycetaceae bacterium]|nr:ATP-dependent chaperone ClpB [Planctomycetaceae bacterium]